jgi:hypothetical protein
MVFLCIDHGCVGLVVHSHDPHYGLILIVTILIMDVLHLWSYLWLDCYFSLDYGRVVCTDGHDHGLVICNFRPFGFHRGHVVPFV